MSFCLLLMLHLSPNSSRRRRFEQRQAAIPTTSCTKVNACSDQLPLWTACAAQHIIFSMLISMCLLLHCVLLVISLCTTTDHLRPRPAAIRSPDTFTRYSASCTQARISNRFKSDSHSSSTCNCRSTASAARMEEWFTGHDRPVWKDSRNCSCSAGFPEASASREHVQC